MYLIERKLPLQNLAPLSIRDFPLALGIPFITKYHLSPITPGNDVIEGSWKMNPRLSCHTNWIPATRSNINTYLLMPDPFL